MPADFDRPGALRGGRRAMRHQHVLEHRLRRADTTQLRARAAVAVAAAARIDAGLLLLTFFLPPFAVRRSLPFGSLVRVGGLRALGLASGPGGLTALRRLHALRLASGPGGLTALRRG